LRSPPFTNRLEMFMVFFLENEKNRLKDVAFFWTPRFGFQSVGKLFVGPTRLSPGGNVALAFFRRGQSTVPKVSRHSESPFGFLRSQVRPQASGLRFLRFQDVIPLRCLTAAWQSSDQKSAWHISVFYSWTYNLNAGVCLQRKVMNEWPQ
jgi:hypothetical protein